MSRQSDDNWVEGLFWVLVKATWAMVVVVAGAALLMYRAVTRQRATQPKTIAVQSDHAPQEERSSPTTQANLVGGIIAALLILAVVLLVVALNSRQFSILGFLLSGGLFVAAFLIMRLEPPPRGSLGQGKAESTITPEPTVEAPTGVNATSYTIRVPADSEWNRERALHLIEQLASTLPHVILRVVADHTAINWQLVDLDGHGLSVVESLLRASWPEAEIITQPLEHEQVGAPFFRVVCSFQQVSDFVAPIRLVTDIRHGSDHFDPLAVFVQGMNALQPGERLILSLGILGLARDAYKQGEKLITQSTIHPLQYATWGGIQDALAKKAYHLDRVERYVPEDQRVLNDKLRQKLYQSVLLLQLDAHDAQRAADLLAHMLSEFKQFSWIPYNALDLYESNLEECVTIGSGESYGVVRKCRNEHMSVLPSKR
jgi:hypothetical protein